MKDEIAEVRRTVESLRTAIADVQADVAASLLPLTEALESIRAAVAVERAASYDPQGDETPAKNLRLAAAQVTTDNLIGEADAAAVGIENSNRTI